MNLRHSLTLLIAGTLLSLTAFAQAPSLEVVPTDSLEIDQGPIDRYAVDVQPRILTDGRAVRIHVPLDPDRGPLKSVRFGKKNVPMMPVHDEAGELIGWDGYAGVPHDADRIKANDPEGVIRFHLVYEDKYFRLQFYEREVISDFYVGKADYPQTPEDINSDIKFAETTPEVEARKKSDREAAGAAYAESNRTLEKKWTGAWRFPVVLDTFKVTSRFGTRRYHLGINNDYHSGVDLRAYAGHPILAPAGGTVSMAQELLLTGNTIIINHGYGVSTVYAHLSRFKVKVGDTVKPGDLIGLSGATGRVGIDKKTGKPAAHLHWMVVLQGVKVDPIEAIKLFR